MNLTITKERVLKAASKSSQAKQTLKTLFPECFKQPRRPLCAGDVYSDPKGRINSYLVVQPMYGVNKYALLGCGCSPNSDAFHHSLHSEAECQEELANDGMCFVRNINDEIQDLVNK